MAKKISNQQHIPDDEHPHKRKKKTNTNIPKSDPLPQRLQNSASKSAILSFYRYRNQPVP